MKKRLLAVLTILLLVLTACGTNTEDSAEPSESNGTDSSESNETEAVQSSLPQLSEEVSNNEKLVEMTTSLGVIKMKLFPEQAPKAVENFITHSKDGYYEGIIFHRVIQDFMIQTGDPQGTGMGGESIFGEPFEDEFSSDLFHFRGALAMANSGANTNGSQFFIVQNKNLDPSLTKQMQDAEYPDEAVTAYEAGGTPWLDGKHTVFGQVIEGMDIVDEIAAAEAENDKPLEDIVIEKITVIE
ncbi:peptidylprolyl isomerase [Cytobacillus gottheilii]|uniref:Peptidyl-prolyl cis-trans isomerase n=1 Tax=Cytobacillus gottheilii TaxID=859144 RepID=A0ABX8FIQ0_9BACI|nr:peptidylprolyl isomerase [Cytobacillus gottheilii]QVY63854.1 peptidylprolyl isomerase [Cytobacillus gottheilii]